MIAASVRPTSTRLSTMSCSDGSHSGAVPTNAYTTSAPTSSRLRPSRSTMRPANGAVRPMTRAGAVSTMGASASTPAVPAKASWMSGRTGASSTAPSTARQLASSRVRAWARPAGRPVAGSTATSPASGSMLTGDGLTTSDTGVSVDLGAGPVTGITGRKCRHRRAGTEITLVGTRYQPQLYSGRVLPRGLPRGPDDEVPQPGVLRVVVVHRVPPHRLDQRPGVERAGRPRDAGVERQPVDQPALQQRDPVAAGDQRR